MTILLIHCLQRRITHPRLPGIDDWNLGSSRVGLRLRVSLGLDFATFSMFYPSLILGEYCIALFHNPSLRLTKKFSMLLYCLLAISEHCCFFCNVLLFFCNRSSQFFFLNIHRFSNIIPKKSFGRWRDINPRHASHNHKNMFLELVMPTNNGKSQCIQH